MARNIDWAGMIFAFFAIVIVSLGMWGWIWNIIKIINHDGGVGMMVVRVIGAFIAPLGSVIGYF